MLPKNMKQWGFPDWKWHENARWRVLLFWEKCQSTIAFAAQKWEMSAVVMGEKMMTGIAKKSAVTICKLDYLVCISLIYSVLWNQWNFRAYIVEIKMMTVFRKMMTQSVKIVKLKEVKWLVFRVLTRNDDNDSLKKIWAHTVGG